MNKVIFVFIWVSFCFPLSFAVGKTLTSDLYKEILFKPTTLVSLSTPTLFGSFAVPYNMEGLYELKGGGTFNIKKAGIAFSSSVLKGGELYKNIEFNLSVGKYLLTGHTEVGSTLSYEFHTPSSGSGNLNPFSLHGSLRSKIFEIATVDVQIQNFIGFLEEVSPKKSSSLSFGIEIPIGQGVSTHPTLRYDLNNALTFHWENNFLFARKLPISVTLNSYPLTFHTGVALPLRKGVICFEIEYAKLLGVTHRLSFQFSPTSSYSEKIDLANKEETKNIYSSIDRSKLFSPQQTNKAALSSSPVRIFFAPAAANDTNGCYYNFIKFIESANSTLVCAFHELDLFSVANALATKRKEGVEVHILLEKDYLDHQVNAEIYQYLLKSGVNCIPDFRNSGLMHNKYMIADKKRVWTGSANVTEHCMFLHYNDSIWIESPQIAKVYLDDFYSLANPSLYRKSEGLFKRYKHFAGDTPIDIYFSPKDSPLKFLAHHLKDAKKEISLLSFVFSSAQIADLLIDQIGNGVTIRGCFDNSFSSEASTSGWNVVPFDLLKKAGARVKYDNETAKIHHKLAIVDNSKVITGSFNYSINAEKNNNENLIVIHSEEIAKLYRKRVEIVSRMFPEKSLEERAREKWVAGNKKIPDKKDQLPYSIFEEFFKKDHYKAINEKRDKLLKSKRFNGVVREIVAGDIIKVEVEGIEDFLTVELSGVAAPLEHHQEPWGTLAIEYLSYHLSQRNITIEPESEIDWLHLRGFVSLLENNSIDSQKKSITNTINYRIVREGLAFLETETLQKYTELFSNGARLAIENHNGFYATNFTTPSLPNLEKERQLALNRDQRELLFLLSLPEFVDGCIVATRKQKKYYDKFMSEYYSKREEDSNNLIYFKTSEDAERCGFKKSRSL